MKKQTPLTQVLLASLLLAPTSALLLSPLAASAAETKPAAKPAPAIELGAPFADNAILPPLHPRLRPPHEPTPRISKFLGASQSPEKRGGRLQTETINRKEKMK